MYVICPHCNKEHNLEKALEALSNRRIAAIYREMGGVPSTVYEYLLKFRSPCGRLSESRHLKILEELHEIFVNRQFQWQRQIIPCPQKLLFQGMLEVNQKEDVLYLKNNNYLRVMLRAAAQALGLAQAEEQVAQEKVVRETPPPASDEPRVTEPEEHGEPLTAEKLAELRKDLPWNKERREG